MAKILEELAELNKLDKEASAEAEKNQEDDEDLEVELDEEEDAEQENSGEDEQEEKVEEPEQKAEESDDDFRVRKNEYYKLRREKQKLERENQELKQSRTTDEESADDDLLAEVKKEVMIKRALREFTEMESSFVREAGVDDYEDVTSQYRQAVYNSLRVMNPKISHEALLDQTRETILMRASQYVQQGLDPIAELYYSAKELGFKKMAKEATKEDAKETPKPDLKKVAANKKRSAGMAGSSASGRPEITAEAAASMSPAEFAKLSKEDKDRFLRSA